MFNSSVKKGREKERLMKGENLTHFLIILIVFGITACSNGFEDCHDALYLENKSQSSIYYVTTLKDGFLNYNPLNPEYAADYKLKPGDTQKVRIGVQLSCWEQVLENAGGYVYIYIYDAATLEAQGWNATKDNPIKKYTFSAKQLQSQKWKITHN